jgi:acetyl-CoA carboxylase carboxyltransferase component
MVNAVSNSTVPKISIVIGNSYGAGNYAMCGKAYDPRFIFAWPTAKIAVMGGIQAAKVLAQIKGSALKAKGEKFTKKREKEMIDEIKEKYDTQTSAYYAAARLWVDEIIDPRETRDVISKCLTVANYAPIEEFNVGVIQT